MASSFSSVHIRIKALPVVMHCPLAQIPVHLLFCVTLLQRLCTLALHGTTARGIIILMVGSTHLQYTKLRLARKPGIVEVVCQVMAVWAIVLKMTQHKTRIVYGIAHSTNTIPRQRIVFKHVTHPVNGQGVYTPLSARLTAIARLYLVTCVTIVNARTAVQTIVVARPVISVETPKQPHLLVHVSVMMTKVDSRLTSTVPPVTRVVTNVHYILIHSEIV